jgi:hypothetical protein
MIACSSNRVFRENRCPRDSGKEGLATRQHRFSNEPDMALPGSLLNTLDITPGSSF